MIYQSFLVFYFSRHHSLPTLLAYMCLDVHMWSTCYINYTAVSVRSSRGRCVPWHVNITNVKIIGTSVVVILV